MSKVVAAIVAGSGATAASVGGIYIMQKGSGTDSPQEDKESGKSAAGKRTQENESKLEFESLDEFIKQPDKTTCVKNYFTGLMTKEDATEVTADQPTSTSFFATGSEGKSSCLKIEYKKTTYKDNI